MLKEVDQFSTKKEQKKTKNPKKKKKQKKKQPQKKPKKPPKNTPKKETHSALKRDPGPVLVRKVKDME